MSQPGPEIYLYAVGSWAGYPVMFAYVCLEACLLFLCCVLCVRLVYSSFCIYNRNNTYTNIQNTQND